MSCTPLTLVRVLAALGVATFAPPLIAAVQCPFAWNESLQQPGGTVYAATTWDDGQGPKLYMSGDLTMDANSPAGGNALLRWDVDHWTALGGLFEHMSGSYTVVHALIEFRGDLIAAGDFVRAGGNFCNHIARWDGAQWQPLGPGLEDVIYAMTVFNNELVVAGESNIQPAIWNGATWRLATGVANGAVHALAVYNGQLIAGGEMAFPGTLARYTGTGWVSFANNNGYVYALGTYDNQLVAGGSFSSIGGTFARCIARWDGSHWSDFGSGMTSGTGLAWVGALSSIDGDLLAGGRFNTAGGTPANYVARWNGLAWSRLGDGIPVGHSDAETKALGVWNGQVAAGGFFRVLQIFHTTDWSLWSPACARGDLDCDHAVTTADVALFVEALLSSEEPDVCALASADINRDGRLNGNDVAPLLACVVSGACP